jgi:hypothetical protein
MFLWKTQRCKRHSRNRKIFEEHIIIVGMCGCRLMPSSSPDRKQMLLDFQKLENLHNGRMLKSLYLHPFDGLVHSTLDEIEIILEPKCFLEKVKVSLIGKAIK